MQNTLEISISVSQAFKVAIKLFFIAIESAFTGEEIVIQFNGEVE